MSESARGDGEGQGANEQPVGRGVVLRRTQQPQPEGEQDQRHGIRDATQRAGDDRVDDIPDDAGEPPPLASCDDDSEPDEREAQAIPTVLRLELTRRRADLADRATGEV